jgi:hypothetical protein
MMDKLLNLTIITVYIYAVTILTHFGYMSYFGIPSSFLGASIQENVLHFFFLSQVGIGLIVLIKWWVWIFIFPIAIILILNYFFNSRFNLAVNLILIAILGFFLWKSSDFGAFLAANTSNFYTLSSECPAVGSDKLYIIPIGSDTNAVLIPIDENSKKMKDGFLIKNMAELSCKIEMREIGKITK